MENRAVLTPFQKKINSLKTYVSKLVTSLANILSWIIGVVTKGNV
mgnify:CR=1 FL=1